MRKIIFEVTPEVGTAVAAAARNAKPVCGEYTVGQLAYDAISRKTGGDFSYWIPRETVLKAEALPLHLQGCRTCGVKYRALESAIDAYANAVAGLAERNEKEIHGVSKKLRRLSIFGLGAPDAA